MRKINSLITALIFLTTLGAQAALPVISYTRTDFMTGLSSPWDIAFFPDSTMLYTEKCRGLSARFTDGTTAVLFGVEGAGTVASDLFCEGQSGIHGIAIDPNFATNRSVFLYMASKDAAVNNGLVTNHVVRLEINPTFTGIANRTDIITDIPFKNVGNSWGDPGSHSGGRVRFGPDGFLYVTTGDNHNGTLPQDLQSLGGKVLRVDRDGVGAAGNNSAGDARIFTYGHRNVQGITFNPTTGQPIISEHGPGHSDEVTALTAGGNGGWDPKPDAGVTCADNYCGYTTNNKAGNPTSMTDLKKFPGAMLPVLSNDDSQGLGPITFLTGSQWKEWDGTFALGIMGGQRIEVVQLDTTGNVVEKINGNLPSERPRSLVQAPDGFLYVVTDSGNIWQVKPN